MGPRAAEGEGKGWEKGGNDHCVLCPLLQALEAELCAATQGRWDSEPPAAACCAAGRTHACRLTRWRCQTHLVALLLVSAQRACGCQETGRGLITLVVRSSSGEACSSTPAQPSSSPCWCNCNRRQLLHRQSPVLLLVVVLCTPGCVKTPQMHLRPRRLAEWTITCDAAPRRSILERSRVDRGCLQQDDVGENDVGTPTHEGMSVCREGHRLPFSGMFRRVPAKKPRNVYG